MYYEPKENLQSKTKSDRIEAEVDFDIAQQYFKKTKYLAIDFKYH